MQSIDEIALNVVLTMFSGNELSEACALLRRELSARNIDLIHTKNIIETYQELQKMPQQLEKQFADYQLIKADFERKVQAKLSEIHENGTTKYSECQKQFNEIQRSPLRRLVGKIPWSRTHKELAAITDSMNFALSDISTSEQDVIEAFFKEDEKPFYSAPCYWTQIDSIEPDMKVIETESDLNLVIAEIREQLLNPDNQKAYKDCLFFYNTPVSSVPATPVSSAPQAEQDCVVSDSSQKNTAKKSKHKETIMLR